jgi:hypothetical protein
MYVTIDLDRDILLSPTTPLRRLLKKTRNYKSTVQSRSRRLTVSDILTKRP